MKNILSNLTTKKIAGTVLVGASLAIGIAVVNNFGGGKQQPTNEVYQSRLTDNAYNNFRGSGSVTRAEIEKQMATQDRYDARFLKGTPESADTGTDSTYESGVRSGEGFVYSSDYPYASNGVQGTNGVQGANGVYGANSQYSAGVRGAYANGDTYQPFGSTFEQGDGVGGTRGPSSGAYANGERQFQAVQGAAAAAAGEGKDEKGNTGLGDKKSKEKAGKDKVNKTKPATQMNKLAASTGGSSFSNRGSGTPGSASLGGSSAFNSGNTNRGSDAETRVLPQTNLQVESNAFKFGRTGTMGGPNVGLKGGSEVKGRETKGRGAAGDAQLATFYSKSAVQGSRKTEQKALAEAAFDGSNIKDFTPTVDENATPKDVNRDLMAGLQESGFDDSTISNDGKEGVRDTVELAGELKDLQRKLTILKVVTILAAVAFSIGIYFLRKIDPYGKLFAAILTVIALLILVGMCLWMKDTVDQMADEKFKYVNQNIDFGDQYWSVLKTGLISAVIVALGWTNKWEKIINKVKNWFTKPGPIMAGGEDFVIPEDMA